ncbi:MAG TPA: STAS domain-containing protein [Actinomycetospora sp.]|nr:STAS domain-containing protein [Actinomycetospora sp.]
MTTHHPRRRARGGGPTGASWPGRPMMSTTETPSGVHVLRAGATLDAAAAAELRREVRALLARSADPLVVDLPAVHAADRATAADVLRDLAYEAGDADVDLRVVRDPGAREAARALLGDESLFEIYPDLDAALDGAADAPPPGERPDHPAAPGER